MKTALVSLNTPEYSELSYLTFYKNKFLYCEKHGYDAVNRSSGFSDGIPIGFQKIFFVKQLLDSLRYNWIYWCGCDTLITNFNIRLEEFIDPDYHFIIGSDSKNINADSFFVRNTEKGRDYINSILNNIEKYRYHFWFEQQAMIDTLPHFKDIVKILPQKLINAYEYGLYDDSQGLDIHGLNGNWTEGDFLVHWPAIPLAQRIRLAQKYLPKVVGCDLSARRSATPGEIGTEWPKLHVLHPSQHPVIRRSYAPFSGKIIGWALDPKGSCTVELWHGSTRLGKTSNSHLVNHSSAIAAGGEYYNEKCGFEFLLDFIPGDFGQSPVELTVRAASADGRTQECQVTFNENASWEAAKTLRIEREREFASLRTFFVNLFGNAPARVLYLFHNDYQALEDEAMLLSSHALIRMIDQFFPIAGRAYCFLTNETDSADSPAQCIRSFDELKPDPSDFVILLDIAAAWSFEAELWALHRGLLASLRVDLIPPGSRGALDQSRHICVEGSRYSELLATLRQTQRPTPTESEAVNGRSSRSPLLGPGYAFAHINGAICIPERIRSILAIELDPSSDIMAMIPALKRLKTLFGSAKISLLVASNTAPMTKSLALADEVLVYYPGIDLSGRHWDIAIDFRIEADTRHILHNVPAHIKLSSCLNSELEVEFSSDHLTTLGEMPVAGKTGRGQRQHMAEQLYGLVDRIDRKINAFSASEQPSMVALKTDDAARAKAASPHLCILHPGPVEDVRYWESSRYVEVASRLSQKFGYMLYVIGAGKDLANNEKLVSSIRERNPSCEFASDLGDDDLLGLVSSARFFLGIDSGIKHLACLYGVPGVVIHSGRQTPTVWGAAAPSMINVFSPTLCSPCILVHRDTCQNNMLCQDNITVDHVWSAIETVTAGVAWSNRLKH